MISKVYFLNVDVFSHNKKSNARLNGVFCELLADSATRIRNKCGFPLLFFAVLDNMNK